MAITGNGEGVTTMGFHRLCRIGANVGMNCGTLAGLLLGWTGASPLLAQPQLPPNPGVARPASPVVAQRNYVNKHHIQLPIRLDDSVRTLIQEIQLFSKESASEPWTLREKVSPTSDAFTTKVNHDGEYWFAIVTVDKKGRSFPSNLDNEPPGLIVIVDTEQPRIELTNLGVVAAGQLVQCNVSDKNLDNSGVRLSFQGGDKVYRTVDSIPGQPGIFCIPSQAVFTGLIRVSASDLAGNETINEIHVKQIAVAQSAAPNPPPAEAVKVDTRKPAVPETNFPRPLPASVAVGKNTVELVKEPTVDIKPVAVPPKNEAPMLVLPTAPENPATTGGPNPVVPTPVPVIPSEPVRPIPTIPGPAEPLSSMPVGASAPERFPETPVVQQTNYREPVKCQHVNVAKVFLDYQVENVGQSGVGKIEIWLTRDQGKTWEKSAEETMRKSPLEVSLPGDGLFGLTLVASNGRGVPGKTPSAGDAPDMWVRVDTSRPVAQLLDTKVSFENKQTKVTIRWNAKDENLAETPVDILFGATPQGPWLPIAKGQPAEGETTWQPKTEIGSQAYIRIEARDRAGNVGIAATMEPVQLDDSSRPRILIRTIRTEATVPAKTSGPVLLPVPAPPGAVVPPPGPIVVPPPSIR